MKAPVIEPWKSFDDLLYLRVCFFSTEDRIEEGLSKVKAYQIRGSVPHPVECTAFILSVISSDNEDIDNYVLRLSYSMALVRLVNGYVDNYEGNSNFPVYHIAKAIGIPSHFVELRHTATHDSLPSLELLRDVSRQALKWLWNNYWSTSDPIDKRAILYGPLLNQLAGDFFIERLVIRLSKVLSSVGNELDLNLSLQEHALTPDSRELMDHKIASLYYWIEYIFFEKSQSLNNEWFSSLEIVVKYFISFPQPWNLKILRRYFNEKEAEDFISNRKTSSLVDDLISVFESSQSLDVNSMGSIRSLKKELQTFKEKFSEVLEYAHHSKNEADDLVNNEILSSCGWTLQYN